MTQIKSIDEKQKKLLLALPLIAIPFLTLLFWALGGGKVAASAQSGVAGINAHVPGAKLKSDSTDDKLSRYQQAEKDSLQFRQAAKNDPYYHPDTAGKTITTVKDSGITGKKSNGIGNYQPFVSSSRANTAGSLSANEAKVNQQIAQLRQQMNQPPVVRQSQQPDAFSNDSKLAQIQEQMRRVSSDNTPDPQMQQLNQMLDKIKDIQNPVLAREKMKAESEKKRGEVFPVATEKAADPLSTLDNGSLVNTTASNGFYSLNNQQSEDNSQNAVEATVAATQTLVNGATVKLKLTNDIYINGNLIPKNTFVYGTAELSGERLGIKIKSIRYRKSLFPVSLSVYDMDGLDGISIPGAITRDVAKESADESMQSLNMLGYSSSLGAQAAGAGITAAKTLFSRKVRLVKVTVKAGYEVLLKDDKQQQNNQ